MSRPNRQTRAQDTLRTYALGFPGACEEFPWGESAFKVNKKVFVFLSRVEDILRVTVKLPVSGALALSLPFASPTGYGLGKSGWVTAQFAPDNDVPVEMLQGWIDESYRAIAPKKLVATLEDGDGNSTPAAPPKRKKRSAK